MTTDTVLLIHAAHWLYVGSLLSFGAFWALKHPAHAFLLSIAMVGLMAMLGSFADISDVFYRGGVK